MIKKATNFVGDNYLLIAFFLFVFAGLIYGISVKSNRRKRNENIRNKIKQIDKRIVGNKNIEKKFRKIK